jgi:hypothetical protein
MEAGGDAPGPSFPRASPFAPSTRSVAPFWCSVGAFGHQRCRSKRQRRSAKGHRCCFFASTVAARKSNIAPPSTDVAGERRKRAARRGTPAPFWCGVVSSHTQRCRSEGQRRRFFHHRWLWLGQHSCPESRRCGPKEHRLRSDWRRGGFMSRRRAVMCGLQALRQEPYAV